MLIFEPLTTLESLLAIPIPDEDSRKAILEVHIKGMNSQRIQMKRIVEKTQGYSGAELKATCVEAGMIAIRDNRSTVTNADMLAAVSRLDRKKSQGAAQSSPEALYS